VSIFYVVQKANANAMTILNFEVRLGRAGQGMRSEVGKVSRKDP